MSSDYLTISFLLLGFWALFGDRVIWAQIYEVPCSVQSTDGYKWGTAAGLLGGTIITGAVPPLTLLTPPGAGSAVGAASTAILRFLWPMIIGANDKCTSQALQKMAGDVEQMTNQKLNNMTIDEIRRWFDGQADTAKKAHEWIPIIKKAGDILTKRDASLEFLKELKYLYFSANEARFSYIDGATARPESFLFIRELAFLQFAAASEIISNENTPAVVRDKFKRDYQEDVEFYWRAGHSTVEKMVRCLPNSEIGKARLGLSTYMRPLYDFAYKFIVKNDSAVYARSTVYKPIVNGDFVALRLNDGTYAIYETLFDIAPPRETRSPISEGCPRCGWELFDDRYSPNSRDIVRSWQCRDATFDIACGRTLGDPIRTCDTVALTSPNQRPQTNNTSFVTPPSDGANIPVFVILSFNATTNKETPCGVPVLDRDHILLTPTDPWRSKVDQTEGVILKAN